MPSFRETLIANLWGGKDPFHEHSAFANRVDFQGWASNHPYLAESVIQLNPKTIIEIGVWKGGSVLMFAKALRNLGIDGAVIAIDTWLGSAEHWEYNDWFEDLHVEAGYPTLFKTFAANIIEAKLTDYVVPMPIDSHSAAHRLKSRQITADVIHIDGGHDYHAVMGDLQVWWPLLREGGILVANDYHPDGGPWPEVAAAFNDFFNTRDIENIGGKCRIRKSGNSATSVLESQMNKESATNMDAVSVSDSIPAELVLRPFSADRLSRPVEPEEFRASSECAMLTDRQAVNFYMPPIFCTERDRAHFKNDFWRETLPPIGPYPNDSYVLRANEKYISGRRGLEGLTFDRHEVFKNVASLQTLENPAPFRRVNDGFGIDTSYLEGAPRLVGDYISSFNGVAHNYYHALVEIMVSSFIMRTLLPTAKVLVPNSIQLCLDVNYNGLIDAFIGRENIQMFDDVVQVSNVCWIHGDDPLQISPFWYSSFREFAITRNSFEPAPTPKRLYVARRGARSVSNSEEIDSLLEKLNFTKVHLENLSIIEQIALFSNADFIVSPHGAGLSNLLFARAGTKVLELSPAQEFRPFFWLLSEKLGLVYSLLSCKMLEAEFSSKFDVDAGRLSTAIQMLDGFSA